MSRTTNETTVLLYGRWVTETAAAVRFRVDKIGAREMRVKDSFWFPLSQTAGLLKQPLGSEELDTLRVKEWLIIKNGLYDKLAPVAAVKVVEDQNVYGSRVKEAYDPKPGTDDFDQGFDDDFPF